MTKHEASPRPTPLPNPYRWMLFVDGENFTARGQELAAKHGLTLVPGKYFDDRTFLWIPSTKAGQSLYDVNYPLQLSAVRAYYYASVVGDSARLAATREALWQLGFSPAVFKRERSSGRSKGVHISLATDLLSHAVRGSFDVAVLVAGDGDYAPLVEEVKRLGRLVCVAFFAATRLNPDLRLRADTFCEMDAFSLGRWRELISQPPDA